jgi:hypothetical protein
LPTNGTLALLPQYCWVYFSIWDVRASILVTSVCARLIGPEVKLTIEQQLPGNLSPADWNPMLEIIAAVRQAIPDAASVPPGAVLEHVLGALRAAQAKPIELSEDDRSSDGQLIDGTYGHLPSQLGISPITLFRTVEFRGEDQPT